MKTKELTAGALLAAMSLLIPLAFGGFLMVNLPPFTATILAHVPTFIAMLINPTVAVMVGLTSALGFFLKVNAMVGIRALAHALIGYIGARIIKKGGSLSNALIVTLPIHAIFESIVVIPFIGFDLYRIIVLTGIGTALHHIVDSSIAVSLSTVVNRAVKTIRG